MSIPLPDPNPVFYLAQGDLLPALEVYCYDGEGNIVDLTTATAVVFDMSDKRDQPVITSGTGSFISKPDGHISYAWHVGDTDVTGVFFGKFRVTFPGPKPASFPNGGDVRVLISPKRG